jgi:hypothetical protein
MLILGIRVSIGGSGIGGTAAARASVCVDEVTILGSTFGILTSTGEDSGTVCSELGVFGGVKGISTV